MAGPYSKTKSREDSIDDAWQILDVDQHVIAVAETETLADAILGALTRTGIQYHVDRLIDLDKLGVTDGHWLALQEAVDASDNPVAREALGYIQAHFREFHSLGA